MINEQSSKHQNFFVMPPPKQCDGIIKHLVLLSIPPAPSPTTTDSEFHDGLKEGSSRASVSGRCKLSD